MKPLLALLLFTATAMAEEKVSRVIYLPKESIPKLQPAIFPIELPELGPGPLMNLGPELVQWDIKFKPGEVLVWSPAAERAFLHASRETLDKVELLFEFIDDGYNWIDAEFILTKAEPRGIRIKPVRLIARGGHGQKMSLRSVDSNFSMEIEWEAVSQANGKDLDLALQVKGKGDGLKLDIEDSFALKVDEPKVIWSSKDGTYELSVLLKFHSQASVPKIPDDKKQLQAIESRLSGAKP